MPRITVRMSDEQAAAVRAHGAGDAAYGVRRLIAEHLGAGQAERPPPYFSDPSAARKARKTAINRARRAAVKKIAS